MQENERHVVVERTYLTLDQSSFVSLTLFVFFLLLNPFALVFLLDTQSLFSLPLHTDRPFNFQPPIF